MTTKNNIAWKALFDKYGIRKIIEREGLFEISSAKINEFREARLMTKFDHSANLPSIFKENNLSIMPITRGSYVLAPFNAYTSMGEPSGMIKRMSFPANIESLDFKNITSESAALAIAYISGMLGDFLGTEQLLPTVSGRMGSGVFDYFIKTVTDQNIKVNVINAQIEIDGGYEDPESLCLIEAKNFLCSDFLTRQIYYPYRVWTNKIKKNVRPVFLTYSNGIFTLSEFKFRDRDQYNSIVPVKSKKYMVETEEIVLEDILHLMHSREPISEPKIPFPQANSFERVINLCELLNEQEMTREEITENYDFDPRQTNYYTDAARYLGLVDKEERGDGIYFKLSEEGSSLFSLDYKARQLKFVELMLQHEVFYRVMEVHLDNGQIPKREAVVYIMKNTELYGIGADSTYLRRSTTVISWIKWIAALKN